MTEELEPGFEILPQDAPRPRRSTRLLATAAAAVVLAGGGVATYAAFAGDDPGSDSPQAAVSKVIDDLTHADLLGVIDDLAPGERDALRGAFTSDVASLKRLGVLAKDANPSSVGGVTFTARGLTYGTPLQVNDDVQVVRIDGGTLDASAAVAKLPLTSRLLELTHASKQNAVAHHVITAADPLRLAAQKVGGRWYASVFYSIADDAADHKAPGAGDQVAAKGAGSAEDAVRTMITDLAAGKVRDAIAVISPTELAALHDYGGLIADKTGDTSRIPLTISSLDLTSKPVDGGTEVSLKKLAVAIAGRKIGVEVANGCIKISSDFINKNLCGADIADTISGFITSFTCSSGFSYGSARVMPHYVPLSSHNGSGSSAYRSKLRITYDKPSSCAGPTFTAAQKTALTHLFSALLGSGLVATETSGEWYVAPVRTIANLTSSTLTALQGDDLFALASLGR